MINIIPHKIIEIVKRYLSRSNDKDRNKLVLCLIYIVLNIIHILFIKDMTLPIILDDEFGYLANAAFLAGFDWSTVVSKIFYYSNGYSLLLVPFFMIAKNPFIIYKSALILNSVLINAVIFVAFRITNKVVPHFNSGFKILLSLVVSLYPSYTIYSCVAWPENLLSLLFWVCVLLFLEIGEKTNKTWIYIVTGVILGYLYMTHTRTIGIVLTGCLVLFISLLLKKIKLKYFLLFLLGLLPVLVIQIILKRFLISYLWLDSITSNTNNYGSVPSIISKIIAQYGFLDLIKAFLGQLYYLGVSTYILFYIGLFWVIKKCLLCTKKFIIGKMRKVECNSTMINEKNVIALFFIALSVISTFMTSVLFSSGGERVDHVLYGRYNESCIGPILLIGILFMIDIAKKSNRSKGYYRVICFFLLLSIVLSLLVEETLKNKILNYITITSLFIYQYFISQLQPLIVVIVVTLLSLILHLILRSKIKYNQVIFLCLVAVCFLLSSFMTVRTFLIPVSHSNQEIIKATDLIRKGDNKSQIFFVDRVGTLSSIMSKDIYQTLLYNRKINFIDENNIEILTNLKDSFIITNSFGYSSYLSESKLLAIDNLRASYLWITPGVTQKKLEEEGVNYLSQNENSIMVPLNILSTQNNINTVSNMSIQHLQSNGSEGFLTHGPYINVEAGQYLVAFDLELIKTDKNDIGYIDIIDSKNQHYRTDIIDEVFDNGKHLVKCHLNLLERSEQLEFRIFTNYGVVLKVNKIMLSVLNSNKYSWLPQESFRTINGSPTEKGTYVSNGNSGFLLYGPYLKLSEGSYKLNIKGKKINTNKGVKIGYVDVVANSGTEEITRRDIVQMELEEGDLMVELDFSLNTPVQDVEFRVWIDEGNILEVEEITVEKMTSK